jgi:SAM-dependent methyltransferase
MSRWLRWLYKRIVNSIAVVTSEAEKTFWKLWKREQVHQLETQIEALSPDGRKSWYYYINFGYGVTVRPELKRDPHSGEKNWVGFLSRHLPNLANKRVLDIGCNAGLYDLRMVEAGAREVVGIDLDVRIRQAEFVREWFAQKSGQDYSRVRLIAADVTDFDLISLGPFDLACMFCVAYHLGDGINHVMEQLAQITDTVALQGNTLRLTNPKYRNRPHQHLAGVTGMHGLLQSCNFSKIKVFAPRGHPKPLVIGWQSEAAT